MIKSMDIEMIVIAFELVDGKLRQQMLHEFDSVERLPVAVGRIIIFADAMLPGCIARISRGAGSLELGDLLVTLENENPFADKSIIAWLKRDGAVYPGTFTYLMSLDAVRRWAMDLIGQTEAKRRLRLSQRGQAKPTKTAGSN